MQLNADERETALLKAAGAVALYQRIGRLPVAAPTANAACELNDAPVINERAALRLRMMLKDARYQSLLPEWLNAVAQRGLRLPAAVLPKLLQLGADKNEWRESLLPALGARGRWLAAQYPAGQWVTGDTEDETIWHEGTREQRVAFLKRLRQRDATQARELLLANWTQEPPQERADFIGVFITNLTLADEPFLESALDDKRKEVRTQATDLLARLSESAFAQRMLERARTLLTFQRKLVGKNQLEVNPLAECDKAMQRDGFEKNAKQITAELRASWVERILAVVPPRFWQEHLSATPIELIAVSANWKATLLQGWQQACLRYPTVEWITALLSASDTRAYQADWRLLFEALQPSECEAFGLQAFNEKKLFDREDPLGWMLPRIATKWSEPFSRKLIESLAQRFNQKPMQEEHWWRDEFIELAQSLAPTVYPFAATALDTQIQAGHNGSPALQTLLDVLQFRYEMLKEIAS